MYYKKQGFTLIELLVVISIIGLLSTLAVVAFGNARMKSRDTKRVSDVKSIQTGLELYYGDNDNYPTAVSAVTLGLTTYLYLGKTGFSGTAAGAGTPLYMTVPKDPTSSSTYKYDYTSADGSTYSVTFKTEQSSVSGLASGQDHSATPAGIQ